MYFNATEYTMFYYFYYHFYSELCILFSYRYFIEVSTISILISSVT